MLRKQRFDLVIDLQGLFRSGLMTLATGAPRRVGLSSAREGAAWFYTDVVRVADCRALHAVDRYWLIAEALGAGAGPKTFRVPLPEPEQNWAAEALHGYPRPWLVMGAGSRWLTKRWPPEHFAALARQAQERFGGTVVFVGSQNEAPLARATAARLSGPVLDLTGQHHLAAAGGAPGPGRRDGGQRYRAAAPGRGPGPAGGGALYLHQDPAHGPYGAQAGARRDAGLVPGELSQTLRPAGVHGRADARPPLARPVGVLAAWEQQPIRLILASGSPARRELLERAGYPFEVMPAHVDEPAGGGRRSAHFRPARRLAQGGGGGPQGPSRGGAGGRHHRLAGRPGDRQARRRGRRPPHPATAGRNRARTVDRRRACGAGPKTCSWPGRK